MKLPRCHSCKYGAIMHNEDCIYLLKASIKKNRTIHYDEREYGCRDNNNFEEECIKNKFSKYEKI